MATCPNRLPANFAVAIRSTYSIARRLTLKLLSFFIMGFTLLTTELSAQTIMENPTACFGRDCYPATLVPATQRIADSCYRIEGNSFIYDLDRPGCNTGPLKGSSTISVNFGSLPTTVKGQSFALYSLEEIQNTAARYGSKIRMSATFNGSYEACPSVDTWLGLGFPVQDSVVISCGNNRTSVDFNIDRKVGRFQGLFAQDFGSSIAVPYKDFDLSRCTSDMIVWYSTANVCKLNIELLELVFQQK